MRTRVRTRRRSFGFEPLESRTMLAGDVQVRVDGNDLIVIGDDDPNIVAIQGAGVTGSYLIQGADNTNVFFNGQLQGGAFIVTDATGNIIIDLNGGDDALNVNNVVVDKLIIETDEGDDAIALGPFAEALGLGLDFLGLDGGGGGGGPLPTGPEVDNGNLIDNDVPENTVGHFELRVGPGGDSLEGGFTAQGRTLLFVNEDFIFNYFGYVDVGERGNAVQLGNTTITQPPTLVADDVVESRGFFFGDSEQRINWVATTSIEDGDARITTEVTFTTVPSPNEIPPGENNIEQQQPTFGDLRFISYLDEDVGEPDNDIMYLSGVPGAADFKVFTVDNEQRVGFAHGGVYTEGPGLVNAHWKGWAADEFPELRNAIIGTGTSYSEAGNIDSTSLPPGVDPEIGPFFGPNDVTTAFAWRIDADAISATVTFFLEFVPGEDDGNFEDVEGSVGVNELLVINTHGGNDLLAVFRVFGGATWDISLGDEHNGTTNLTDDNPFNDIIDGVHLNDQAFVFIASGGDIDINAGAGDDLVNINYLTAHGTLVVDGVTGNDVVSVNGSVFNDDVVLLGGSGIDTVAVDFSRHDGGRDAVLVIDSGADSDFILFARSLITEGDVHIRSGGGSDRVVVGLYYADIFGNLATGGNVVGTLSIDTGGENDTADIRANLVEELFGIFGGGDDTVTVAFNHVTSDDTVGLGGGGGFDKLIKGGNIFGEHVHIHDFEALIDFLFGDGDTESPGTDV